MWRDRGRKQKVEKGKGGHGAVGKRTSRFVVVEEGHALPGTTYLDNAFASIEA